MRTPLTVRKPSTSHPLRELASLSGEATATRANASDPLSSLRERSSPLAAPKPPSTAFETAPNRASRPAEPSRPLSSLRARSSLPAAPPPPSAGFETGANRASRPAERSGPLSSLDERRTLLAAPKPPSAALETAPNHASRPTERCGALTWSESHLAATQQPSAAFETGTTRVHPRIESGGALAWLRSWSRSLLAVPRQPSAALLYVLLLVPIVVSAASGCRSPGLVAQLCVGEDCPPSSECRDGSCERQPQCTLERCNAGLCDEPQCTALRCAAGIAGPTCPEPCPGGVCTPVCTSASCPVASCDGGQCGPALCTGVDCPPVDSCDGGMCAPPPPAPDAGCDGGMCEPTMSDCDADAGGCGAPSCETGPCIAAACDDCEPDPGCNEAFPTCPTCRSDSDCGQGETRRCDVARGRCVECLDASHCGGYEPFCVEGDCEECRDDDDCIGRGLGRCRSGDCGF